MCVSLCVYVTVRVRIYFGTYAESGAGGPPLLRYAESGGRRPTRPRSASLPRVCLAVASREPRKSLVFVSLVPGEYLASASREPRVCLAYASLMPREAKVRQQQATSV